MKYGLTAAVIGSGYMGEQYLEILSGLVERVILCSNDEAKGRALSQKYRCDFYMDYEELYKGETPDFVCICLPTNLHCDAGKSVSASASWRNAKDFPFYTGYDVVFENATLQRQGDDVILYKSGTAENPLENENFSEFFKNDDSLYNELNYFCYVIENGIIPELCPPEETLKTMLLNHSEAVSLKSGKEVKIC